MSINLRKGGSINLTKANPKLSKIYIGLGWELLAQSVDLDATMFILGSNGKLLSEQHFIFYNNLRTPDGSIAHQGDNRTGVGDGDDELILANLHQIQPEAQEILVYVTIHEATARAHNFGKLSNAYIRLVDVEKKSEIANYDLDAEASFATEVLFGKLKRADAIHWEFVALGEGSNVGLQGLVDRYV
ncbi:tellurium resistance protein TerD [Cytophagales bacterium WSM2-2]|nr:tellurium resistance protein TerD [Cytophagales bacterium WSM2-2]